MPGQVRNGDDVGAKWKERVLVGVGVLVLIGVAVLVACNATKTMLTEVNTTTLTDKKTSVSGKPISDAFLTAAAGFGVVLVIAGAFFSRITKLVLPGGIELDFDTTATIGAKAAAAAKGDPAKTKKIAKEATKRAHAAAQLHKGQADDDGFAKFKEDDINDFVLESARYLGIDAQDLDEDAVKKKLV